MSAGLPVFHTKTPLIATQNYPNCVSGGSRGKNGFGTIHVFDRVPLIKCAYQGLNIMLFGVASTPKQCKSSPIRREKPQTWQHVRSTCTNCYATALISHLLIFSEFIIYFSNKSIVSCIGMYKSAKSSAIMQKYGLWSIKRRFKVLKPKYQVPE